MQPMNLKFAELHHGSVVTCMCTLPMGWVTDLICQQAVYEFSAAGGDLPRGLHDVTCCTCMLTSGMLKVQGLHAG